MFKIPRGVNRINSIEVLECKEKISALQGPAWRDPMGNCLPGQGWLKFKVSLIRTPEHFIPLCRNPARPAQIKRRVPGWVQAQSKRTQNVKAGTAAREKYRHRLHRWEWNQQCVAGVQTSKREDGQEEEVLQVHCQQKGAWGECWPCSVRQ